jgi:hypothetical protein
LYKKALRSFSLITVWLCGFFLTKNISAKANRKMMMKSTEGYVQVLPSGGDEQ